MYVIPSHAYLRGLMCKDMGLEVKTSAGVIHNVPAMNLDQACTATLKVEWIARNFSVRVPTRQGAPAIAEMDTRSLKLDRLITP